jgi:hypothetical protein
MRGNCKEAGCRGPPSPVPVCDVEIKNFGCDRRTLETRVRRRHPDSHRHGKLHFTADSVDTTSTTRPRFAQTRPCQGLEWIISALPELTLLPSSSQPICKCEIAYLHPCCCSIPPNLPRRRRRLLPPLLDMSKLRGPSTTDASRLPATSEEGAVESPEVASLAPPRPRFMASASRSSWSSFSSDNSDPERSPTIAMPTPLPAPLPKPTKLRKSMSGADHAPATVSEDIQEEPIQGLVRSPPVSFTFPFQSHPGNPDPLPPRPFHRASLDFPREGFRDQNDGLPSPYAPFMVGAPGSPPSPASSSSHVYRNSVAGNLAQDSQTHLPRVNSVPTFRSPFLSPASRPSSTIWSPPSQTIYGSSITPNVSTPQLGLTRKSKPLMPSTMLSEKLSDEAKPWLGGQKGDRSRLSWWLTALMWSVGLCVGALKVFLDYKSISLLDSRHLCSVFEENFDSLNLNDWTPDIQLAGFGYVDLASPVTFSLAESLRSAITNLK